MHEEWSIKNLPSIVFNMKSEININGFIVTFGYVRLLDLVTFPDRMIHYHLGFDLPFLKWVSFFAQTELGPIISFGKP